MNTGSGIQIPENLFKAIDRVHKEATDVYKTIDAEAMELISPTRGDKLTNTNPSKSKLKL